MKFFAKSPFWEAFGLIAGMIIGSGMFVLPYAVSVSGFWASVVSAVLAFFAVISIHLAYGEIVLNTAEKHRLPGYAKLYLGEFAGNFSKISQIVFFNAALLIYGVLGGVFLKNIFGGSEFFWSILFFMVSAFFLTFESIDRIGFLNFILTIPLVGAVLLISFAAFWSGGVAEVRFFGEDPLFAFGIFMFALTGLSAIPDAREVFDSKIRDSGDSGVFKKVIVLSTAVPLALYVVFVFAILTASGGVVSEDAISSLGGVLGRNIVILGALVGFLAVITSFLVLAYDLRRIYELDAGIPKVFSWGLSIFLPASLFMLGMKDFAELISIVGGIFVAVDGFFVILILRKIRASAGGGVKLLRFGFFEQALLALIFTGSIIYKMIY